MLSANEKNKNKTHLLRAPRRKSRPQLRGMQCHMSRVRPILRLIHEYLQTRGLGPYATGPGGRGHKSSRPHPSCGRGRGRGGVFGQFPPPNLPPDLPRGQFANGPRHDVSANYSYGTVNRGYSGWGAAARQWSPPPPEDAYAYEYGVAACERSFGEGQYGDVAGRYGYCRHHDDRHYFRQQRETTGKIIIMVFPRLRPTHFSRG